MEKRNKLTKIGRENSMEELKDLVQETENVEQPTEEVVMPKTYTEEEVNAIVGKRLARNTAKIRKEYEKKYGDLEEVLRAGTGKESVTEMTDTFRQFYESKGIKFEQKPQYSDKDIEVLAQAEAREFIDGGYEDVKEELDRLADIGVANMNAREKAIFRVLAEHEKNARELKELSRIGVKEEVYESKEFKEFSKHFNSTTPITTIYELYNKTQPKKEIQTMGSVKSITTKDTGVKEFYTVEEARAFTKKDFDANPKLFEAVQKSMLKWKR